MPELVDFIVILDDRMTERRSTAGTGNGHIGAAGERAG